MKMCATHTKTGKITRAGAYAALLIFLLFFKSDTRRETPTSPDEDEKTASGEILRMDPVHDGSS